MARNNLIPLLAGCVTLAALFCLVSASTKQHQFTIYQQMDPSKELEVWNSASKNLPGIIYQDKCTKDPEPSSELVGKIGGVYWTIFKTTYQEILNEVSSIRGVNGDSDSALHLRTQWYLTGTGVDYATQQGSIVGGSGSYAGAYGNVTFTQSKNNQKTFRIDGVFAIDD